MSIRISLALDSCLADLEAAETKKAPSARRHVPTIAELSKAVGITRAALYRMMNGTTRSINLDTLTRILIELRSSGFEVKASSLIEEYEIEVA